SSCTQSEDEVPARSTELVPVQFSTYLGQPAQVKAGKTGELTATTLTDFGVFAEYTHANASNTYTPNFMYNEKITGTTGSYTYADVALTKYWPNEVVTSGDTDGNGATTTDGVDALSFWAYAPYVKVTPSTGALDSETPTDKGITAISKNNENKPTISYTVASSPENSVDLCYGVSNMNSWTPVVGTKTINKGDFITLLTKPAVDTKVDILFKHALSKLSIEAATSVAKENAPLGNTQESTKVTIEKIEIKSTAKLNQSGKLDLTDGTWSFDATTKELALNVEGDYLRPSFKDGGDQVQTVEGVTGTLQSVFKDETTMLTVIPTSTTTKLDVTITYYVTTPDEKLAATYARVKNVITKQTGNITFEQGKNYKLKLVLGLADVQFDATVEEWTTTLDTQADLPKNK
ncbi:MAG: hypothetical protein IJ244_04065, partial [Bacteroidaceae bacterium]|nr:hypothetical protein [Bacteroidaceae bacterium]